MKYIKILFISIISLLFLFFTACSNSFTKDINTTKDNIKQHSNELFISNDWGSSAINYTPLNISNVKIGVIDTANYYQSDKVTNITVNDLNSTDLSYHGSYIVAILSKLLPETQIVSINVADENGEITYKSLSKGIAYATEINCDIINISLGTQYDYTEIKTEVESAIENGCIIIAAAGNDYKKEIDYPAKYRQVISVMSRNVDNIDDDSSNISIEKKSFSAPGSVVFNDNQIISGSSISTAYVTAEVAIIKSLIPNISTDEIKSLLIKSSVFSTEYSYGMINHDRILSNIDILKEELNESVV